jgi:membrane fusion protein, multidrug efflux system
MHKNLNTLSKLLVNKITVSLLFSCVIYANLSVAETASSSVGKVAKTPPIAAKPIAQPNMPTVKPAVITDDINLSNQLDTSNLAASTANPVRVLLVPDKETTISSTMAARIITFNGTLGQSFRAGDTLVVFDCEEALARVEMSKAELAGAIDQHEAKVKMQGLEQASDVEVALAASAANKAKAQLSLNQAQVSQCRIYAPWSGRVAKAIAKNHMTVTPSQPLMELVNSGPLKLKLNAPSRMISRLKAGTKFNVLIDETGNQYVATVSAVNSRVDPVSQTVEIEARMVKSYPELLSGMSGVADFSSLEFR